MNIFTEQGWLDIWDAAIAGGAMIDIRLFKNNHVPADTDTAADYTTADFSGYPGPVGLIWGSAFVNDADQGEVDAAQVDWEHNGGGTANLIYGVFVISGTGHLVYAERFDAPISMAAPPDAIHYIPRASMIDQ